MTTYRHDLAERTRALLNKISSRQTLLQQLNKQVSDALPDGARLDYYAPNLGPLNDRRMSAMDEIRHARREMEAIREEKRKLLADAYISDPHIGVDELPTTQSEFQFDFMESENRRDRS